MADVLFRRTWLRTAALFVTALIIGASLGSIAGIRFQQAAVTAARQQAAQAKRAADQQVKAMSDSYLSKVADLASQQDLLNQQQTKLDQRQKDLDARTVALKATSFADGVWVVGTDIQPGTYRAVQPEASCYWAKLKTDDGIISNDIPGGPTTVTIDASVPKFKSQRCGTWTKIG